MKPSFDERISALKDTPDLKTLMSQSVANLINFLDERVSVVFVEVPQTIKFINSVLKPEILVALRKSNNGVMKVQDYKFFDSLFKYIPKSI